MSEHFPHTPEQEPPDTILSLARQEVFSRGANRLIAGGDLQPETSERVPFEDRPARSFRADIPVSAIIRIDDGQPHESINTASLQFVESAVDPADGSYLPPTVELSVISTDVDGCVYETTYNLHEDHPNGKDVSGAYTRDAIDGFGDDIARDMTEDDLETILRAINTLHETLEMDDYSAQHKYKVV
jgi:hypothetical protein